MAELNPSLRLSITSGTDRRRGKNLDLIDVHDVMDVNDVMDVYDVTDVNLVDGCVVLCRVWCYVVW